MKEPLISFKTAKLAKEKGFNLKVYGFYKGEELVLENQLTDVVLGIDDILYNYNKNNSVSAPTQSLLQKWLREVHRIKVDAMCQPSFKNLKNETSHWEILASTINPYKHLRIEREDEQFTNYEECLEVGLQEVLKLI